MKVENLRILVSSITPCGGIVLVNHQVHELQKYTHNVSKDMKGPFPKIVVVLFIIAAVASGCTSRPVRNVGPDLFPSNIPSNICYLKTTRSLNFLFGFKTKFNATGVLFGGQFLITAGHNVYDSIRSKLVEVDVTCKSSLGDIVTIKIPDDIIVSARKVSHYGEHDYSYSYDYAFLKLPNSINVSESIKLDLGTKLESIDYVEVAGYPSGKLQYGKGQVRRPIPNNHTFYYDINTAKGMSGGPVWAEYNGSFILVGVHVSEGMARVVDNELINDFNKWKSELK